MILSFQQGLTFMYLNHFFHIKQRFCLLTMNKLQSIKMMERSISFQIIYNMCRKTMRKTLDITRQIEAFNRFYSRYVTLIVVLFGFCGCAVLNGIMNETEFKADLSMIPSISVGCFCLLFVVLLNSV